jgi:uncharacterized protein YndB with AHSA1/START domain
MPTVRRTRRLAATAGELWELIGDPYHLPRWWPRVSRVENVERDAFTEVLHGNRGKAVRADFRCVVREAPRRIVWEQAIAGTPFERVLRSAHTEIELLPVRDGRGEATGGETTGGQRVTGGEVATDVAIELRQGLRGVLASLGAILVRRAAARTIDEALDGLERIVGG